MGFYQPTIVHQHETKSVTRVKKKKLYFFCPF